MFLFCLRKCGESRGGCVCDRECGVNKGGTQLLGDIEREGEKEAKMAVLKIHQHFCFSSLTSNLDQIK